MLKVKLIVTEYECNYDGEGECNPCSLVNEGIDFLQRFWKKKHENSNFDIFPMSCDEVNEILLNSSEISIIYFIFAFIYLPPDNMFRSKENTSVVTAFIKSAQ